MSQTQVTKFKVYLPARQNQKAGMHPLVHDKGRWIGRVRLFDTRKEAEAVGLAHHHKAVAIPIKVWR